MVPNNHGFYQFWVFLGIPPFKATPIYSKQPRLVFHQLWPPTCVSMASASHPHSPRTSVVGRISTEFFHQDGTILTPWGWVKFDPVFLWPKNTWFFTGVLLKQKHDYGGLKTKTSSTVDGRNLVDHLGCMKPGKYYSPYQLLQDFFHQQYH